jgi:phage gpG-like protein
LITGAIVGAAELVDQLEGLALVGRKHARDFIDKFSLKVLVRSKEKLSDDVLKVRTGRLRRSITRALEEGGDGSITGIVGTNVVYARRQELGFTGTESVREHLVTIKQAFGKKLKGGPVTFTMPAHTRNVDYPAHSFLASSMTELEPDFKAGFAEVAKRIHL